jgi:hypothetical protein
MVRKGGQRGARERIQAVVRTSSISQKRMPGNEERGVWISSHRATRMEVFALGVKTNIQPVVTLHDISFGNYFGRQ